MDKELKILVKENLKIRDRLALLISHLKDSEEIYSSISALIDNEIQQEKYCNK
jgi:predicted component of type VI protein secretion system